VAKNLLLKQNFISQSRASVVMCGSIGLRTALNFELKDYFISRIVDPCDPLIKVSTSGGMVKNGTFPSHCSPQELCHELSSSRCDFFQCFRE
jgi:hypothetical protein